MPGFAAATDDAPAPTGSLTIGPDTHAPIPAHAFEETAHVTLDAALAALTPTRSYGGSAGPNWKRERAEHLPHATGHAVGAIFGHVAVLGSRVLGRKWSAKSRRVLAHALHGCAHSLHPDGGH